MPRGRPFQPGNQFGRGRPRGSRNKRSRLARQLLDEHGEALVRKAMVEALKGDVPLLRTLLGFLLPRWKEAPVQTGPLPTGTAGDVRASLECIFQQVSTGELSLQKARILTGLLATRQDVLLANQYEDRLEALEQLLARDLSEVSQEQGNQLGSRKANPRKPVQRSD